MEEIVKEALGGITNQFLLALIILIMGLAIIFRKAITRQIDNGLNFTHLITGRKLISKKSLTNHPLFKTLYLIKTTTRKEYFTNGELDESKTKIFLAFLVEKMGSVDWAMLDLVKTNDFKKMDREDVRQALLEAFKKCDINLGCKLDENLYNMGVPIDNIDIVKGKFHTFRANTIQRYVEAIDRLYHLHALDNNTYVYMVLELINIETEGMVKHIMEAFDDINGDFMHLELKDRKPLNYFS